MRSSSVAVRRKSLHPVGLLAVAAFVVAFLGALVAPAGPAHAAAYRYWGYYHLQSGKWAFASTGPAKFTPADGSVEGWRFAVADESSARYPRATPSFADVCGATPVAAGKKRVAEVIDYGRPADAEAAATPPAPVAKCASVDPKATGAEALAAVAQVRGGSGGLICALDGYPATGCGDAVKDVSAAAKAADTPVTLARAAKADAPAAPASTSGGMGSATVLTIVVVAVAVLGALTITLLRRRRSA